MYGMGVHCGGGLNGGLGMSVFGSVVLIMVAEHRVKTLKRYRYFTVPLTL
jgi:hypothetical protein